MEAINPKSLTPVDRLCSEIQLFDLCELEKCSFKSGKFCTDLNLLQKFEQIKEEDEAVIVHVPQDFVSDDEEAELDDELYDDELDEEED